MQEELPQIETCNYSNSILYCDSNDWYFYDDSQTTDASKWKQKHAEGIIGEVSNKEVIIPLPYNRQINVKFNNDVEEETMSNKRLVQIIIVDPDEDVPVKESLLYMGEPQFTDLTDQELFFELPIKDLLTKHNEKRKTITDPEASKQYGHEIFLKEIRIKDLKMAVVVIASF